MAKTYQQIEFDRKYNRVTDLTTEAKELLFLMQMEDPMHRRLFEILDELHTIAGTALTVAFPPIDETKTT